MANSRRDDDTARPRSKKRRATTTSSFGVSRRESHDASAFYARFEAPEFDDSTELNQAVKARDTLVHGDARDMRLLPDNSVALVVTSPPYFAGKAYEEDMSRGEVPSSYIEYLDMLRSVFGECKRVLEPGGRIAVNVANLGRRPYRSLSADVIGILQDDLRLWLRGEIIWIKAKAAGGSTAWGSFQRAGNPVLRDLSERVIVASKGQLSRALSDRERAERHLPSTSTMYRDEFIDFTTDIWEFQPESAIRVGHPAPFPTELPNRLIQLYTYEGDLVLDPFMGSGSTALSAMRNSRHFVGYELDAAYHSASIERVEAERSRIADTHLEQRPQLTPAQKEPPDADANFQSRATREGARAQSLAEELLREAGFLDIREKVKLRCGVEVNFTATTPDGRQWLFDVTGAFSSSRPGLKRSDTLWKCLGRASVLHAAQQVKGHLVLLTTDPPEPGSAGAVALSHVTGPDLPVFDVIELRNPEHQARLRGYVTAKRSAAAAAAVDRSDPA